MWVAVLDSLDRKRSKRPKTYLAGELATADALRWKCGLEDLKGKPLSLEHIAHRRHWTEADLEAEPQRSGSRATTARTVASLAPKDGV